jgi:ferredoxin
VAPSEELEVRTSVVARSDFPSVFSWLTDHGYKTVGPTVRDGGIVYDTLDGIDDLPIGWTDVQLPGSYGLVRRQDDALFGYAVPADSFKKYLYPPRTDLLHIRRVDGSLIFVEPDADTTRYAFFGARSCELAAIAVQDRVFLESQFVDRTYSRNRGTAFIIAVNCGSPSASCFCASMGTGPTCDAGYDVVVTELLTPQRHEFLLEAGTPEGEGLVAALAGRDAREEDFIMRDAIGAEAAAQRRSMPDADLQRRLPALHNSPRWQSVAERCLACTSCTLVCPTCFCSTVEDSSAIDGSESTRTRRWDSCFTMDFTNVHGRAVRQSTASRYRQWLTHKLATWHDQFDMSGCVGCGRCITWCPVGIDITAETRALLAEEAVA